MPIVSLVRWPLAATVALMLAADDPDAGSEQRYRGMISSTQISCVAIGENHYGFGNSTGGATLHKEQKAAIDFKPFHAHRGAVLAMAVSPDSTLLATAGADGLVHFWKIELIDRFNTDSEKYSQQAVGRKPAEPKSTLTLTGHSGAAHFVAFDHDGQRLASAGADGTVHLWEVKTGKSLKVLRGHRGAVKGVAFDPEGKQLASAGADKSVRIWDVASGKELKAIANLASPLECVAFNSDGTQVAVGGGVAGKSGLLKVFEAATGKETTMLAGHEDLVTAVVFHPSKARLVSVSRDASAKTWDLESARLLYRDKHREPILRLSLRPDGSILGTASHEVVKFWDGNAEPSGKE